MTKKTMSVFLLGISIILLMLSAGCNRPQAQGETTPTLGVTQAYQTVEARLTAAVAQTPATPAPTDRGAATSTATSTGSAPTAQVQTAAPTEQPTATSGSVATTNRCDRAAAGSPIDVTIPDDTEQSPGQAFTKIWRLQNVGSCTWSANYEVFFFSGDLMGAPSTQVLGRDVAPNQTIDIAVDMLAPQTAGSYQGNWKLRNEADEAFGIGPDASSPFWVRIRVVGGGTATGTATATGPAPSATSTTGAPVHVSGSVDLIPGDVLDLDSAQANAPGSELAYQTNADGQHLLAPQGAEIAVFGDQKPTLDECRAASLGTVPIVVDSLGAGTYLCYESEMGLPGWMRIADFNMDTFALRLELLTWAIP